VRNDYSPTPAISTGRVADESRGRLVVEEYVRLDVIVVHPSNPDDGPALGHRREPAHIQAFVAQRSIVRFNGAIVSRSVGPAEVGLYVVMIGHRSSSCLESSLPLSANRKIGAGLLDEVIESATTSSP
jgi:hypothetical protein